MKKFFEKYSGHIMLVCLTLILVLTIKNYISKGEVMYGQLCIVFALVPPMLQGFNPELSDNKNIKYFYILMTALAVAMLVIQLIKTM